MMSFLAGLAVLLVGGALGWAFLNDSGYVLIAWNQASVEMSLSLAVLLLVFAAVAGVIALEVVLGLFGVRRLVGRWLGARKQSRAWKLMGQGLQAFLREDYRTAERVLAKAARFAPESFPAWWGASRAAAERDNLKQAEQYLVLAESSAQPLAVKLARIRLWVDAGQWEAAAAALKGLYPHHRKEPVIAEWLLTVLTQLQAWDDLAEWMPKLQSVLGRDRATARLAEAHRQIIASLAQGGYRVDRMAGLRRLNAYWKDLPRELQANESLLQSYAEAMLVLGFDDEAEVLVRKCMQDEWMAGLLSVYGRTRSSRPEEALALAAGWLDAHPNHPGLLLAIGRLYLQNRRWDEARECFARSLALNKNPEVYAEYVRLLVQLNDPQAPHYLVAGLQQLTSRPLPNLPLPQEAL